MIHVLLNTIKRFYKAFIYSWQGITYAYKTQWAFRIELMIILLSLPCAYYLANQLTDFILMMSTVMLLPILELINTAIETAINRISYEFHELSGLAKDLGSAALFAAGLYAVFVWGMYITAKIIYVVS